MADAASQHAALERTRLLVVLATIILNIIAVALLTLAPWSDWRTGVALNILDNAILLVHVVRARDGLIGRLMLFGLALGLVELAADAWLVDATGTLDYSPGGGPMLWRSPIWMPLAWQVVAVQFGYVGLRLIERLGAVPGALLTGVLGALNIPYYEEMARHINWWRYGNCRMLLHTPYYIVLGEFFIAAGIGLLATRLRSGGVGRAIGLGAVGGALIFVSYGAAHWLIDVLAR